MTTGYNTGFLQNIHHVPVGENEFQPSLLRGAGVWSKKISLYNKRWRRLTVEKMLAAMRRGLPFCLRTGARAGFVETWVMPNQRVTDFCESRMRQFAELWFTNDAETAGRHYPRNAIGSKSLGALRQMMATYEIVGRKRDNTFQALVRQGVVKATTEHALLAKQLFSATDFGALHGVPRALAQQKRRKGKSRKEKEQRRIGRTLYDTCEQSSSDGEDSDCREVAGGDDDAQLVSDGVFAVEDGNVGALPLDVVRELAGGSVGAAACIDNDSCSELGASEVEGAEFELSDAEGALADCDEAPGLDEILEVQSRLIACIRCHRHHLVPPGYARVYAREGTEVCLRARLRRVPPRSFGPCARRSPWASRARKARCIGGGTSNLCSGSGGVACLSRMH